MFLLKRPDDPEAGEMDINNFKWVKITLKLFGMFQNVFTSNIVKTPTSTQHNPKTTSTDVGFDMNMTVQTNHPTPPHPPESQYSHSTLALENKQCSIN